MLERCFTVLLSVA